jgi:hypothetical protein
MNLKTLAAVTAFVIAVDHLLLDAVLFENATFALIGERKRLF